MYTYVYVYLHRVNKHAYIRKYIHEDKRYKRSYHEVEHTYTKTRPFHEGGQGDTGSILHKVHGIPKDKILACWVQDDFGISLYTYTKFIYILKNMFSAKTKIIVKYK